MRSDPLNSERRIVVVDIVDEPIQIQIDINWFDLAWDLADRVARNRTGKATDARGAIKAQRVGPFS